MKAIGHGICCAGFALAAAYCAVGGHHEGAWWLAAFAVAAFGAV